MSNLGKIALDRGALAAVFFVCALLAVAFSGCVSNDENCMPWAAPDPNDASVNLPGNLSGQ